MNSLDTMTPRAVIDTNALLEWLVFRDPAAASLGRAVEQRAWHWCATAAMLDELRLVLDRPLAERWESARKLALTIDVSGMALLRTAEPVAPRHALVCRDRSDQMFIDLAWACRPCWLVTRDRALLALRRRAAPHGIVVGTPQQWSQHPAASMTDAV
jgi:predicted nucleic acid-binding protein